MFYILYGCTVAAFTYIYLALSAIAISFISKKYKITNYFPEYLFSLMYVLILTNNLTLISLLVQDYEKYLIFLFYSVLSGVIVIASDIKLEKDYSKKHVLVFNIVAGLLVGLGFYFLN